MASSSGTNSKALEGIAVLDVSQNIAGAFCARLLADLGCDVVKVEPPGGDPIRDQYGRSTGLDARKSAALYNYLNWNKRSVVLDLHQEADLVEFRKLLGGTDVVIESFSPGTLDSLGLGSEYFAREHPEIVLTSITPFGQDGPYCHWASDEIVEWAMGGYMYFGGDPAKPPLMVPGYQAQFHGGQAAAVATLAALSYRAKTGLGQHIDQSIQEAVLSAHAWNSVAWTHCGEVLRRKGSDLFACSDGWVMIQRRFHESNIFILIDRPDLIDDERFAHDETWRDPQSEIWQLVREWCRTQRAIDVYRRGQELRIPVTLTSTAADVLASEQLKARDWLLSFAPDGTGKSLKFPGHPYRLSRTSPRVDRPAPQRPGEHQEEVLAQSRHRRPETPRSHSQLTDIREALQGLKVIEVTANWAGPLAGRHLADLGARVIKIEHARRPATRILWYVGNDPGKYHYNRSGYFNKLNRNKEGICLDLAKPEGKEVFLKLVEWADVLIENNSVRVMPNLGLDYETLRGVNPRLIMASISGFGATGPERDYVAYGANIEASCGLASVTGYGDGTPYRVGSFYADPIGGNYATIAILAALLERERSGEGQHIDVSLNEAAITFFIEGLLDYQLEGAVRQRGNRSPVHAPSGCYRAYGDDAWLVLTVQDDAQWASLCRLIGRDDWANDAELTSQEGRRRRHDEIDKAIEAWTANQDPHLTAAALQEAGIPAAPVMRNWELVTNPHLHVRGFYQPISHPDAGVHLFPGMPWRLSRTPGRVKRPAPRFAEHNAEVFYGLLGLSEEEVATLENIEVTAFEPVDQAPYLARP